MGVGYEYFCEKCGKEFSVDFGCGMMYPRVNKALLEEIKSGKYGEEMKTAALSNSNVVVDGEKHLFICYCDYWENTYGLSLFTPKEGVSIDSHFITPYRQRDKFQVLYEYNHQCPECGETMIEADGERIDLRCPVCKSMCSINGISRWD